MSRERRPDAGRTHETTEKETGTPMSESTDNKATGVSIVTPRRARVTRSWP